MSAAAAKQVVAITGMSGSGKSSAIRALEDLGFYCIDNLPAPLLSKVAELTAGTSEVRRLALGMDVREGSFLADAPRALDELRRLGHRVDVLFLDSSDEVLMRRYGETRRRHPLAQGGTVAEGIAQERRILSELKDQAEAVIDTSAMSVRELRADLEARFGTAEASILSLTLLSFGFKYGVPPQVDWVFDMRFLDNPFFVPELKSLTGKDPAVARYVLERPGAQELLRHLVEMIRFVLPKYQKEGRTYVTVGMGCTGGKHRSVAMAEAVAKALQADGGLGCAIRLVDRDVFKD